jgi:hypothetical protein
MPDERDDEQLLEDLRQSLRARRTVPPAFIQAAQNAYAWHNIDAELALLTYDSTRWLGMTVSVRSETASIRALTFTSPHLTIELEIGDPAVLGQIVPPQPATIQVRTRGGIAATIPADEVGCFTIDEPPASPFRLHCQASDGTSALTGWVNL